MYWTTSTPRRIRCRGRDDLEIAGNDPSVDAEFDDQRAGQLGQRGYNGCHHGAGSRTNEILAVPTRPPEKPERPLHLVISTKPGVHHDGTPSDGSTPVSARTSR